MMQKQQNTRLAEKKLRCREQNMKGLKSTSLTISPGIAAVEWFLIMNLLSVQI